MFDTEKDLFIFEMANNHNGDIGHGKNIIESVAQLCKKHGLQGAIKIQLRDLDSFIHSNADSMGENKHVRRFISTRFDFDQFNELLGYARDFGLLTSATIFDENSIPVFEKLSVDILKIGSCSADDLALLKRLGGMNRPTVLSTGGLSLNQVDRAVRALNLPWSQLSIMHCVGIYPTPEDHSILSRIDALKTTFPKAKIGFSTHEDPNSELPIQLAVAKGAEIFEKHVDVPSSEFSINKYSATPEQLEVWIQAYKRANAICGTVEDFSAVNKVENSQLDLLKRGVYAKTALAAGEVLTSENTYFAIPLQDGQVNSAEIEWGRTKSQSSVDENSGIFSVEKAEPTVRQRVNKIVSDTMDMFHRAGVQVPNKFEFEISAHYGISQFDQYGAILMTVINNTFCKKYIVMFAGQEHPAHCHLDRSESLQAVYGGATMTLNGDQFDIPSNAPILVEKDVWHTIRTESGVVLEEITVTPVESSVYADEAIPSNANDRKLTILWDEGEWSLKPSNESDVVPMDSITIQ